MENILPDVSWTRISRSHFGKSGSWIYNKLNGIGGNVGPGAFSENEKETLRHALYELADRIRRNADNFE